MRHLRLLELVGSRGSLTAAATALQIGQPAATKLLHDLEEAFGHGLVDRSTRGGVLSAAGERALERLKIATASIDAISEAMTADATTPLVRIGMLPLAGVFLVPRMVAALAARGELPRIQLREGAVPEVLRWLRDGEIDCVIGRLPPESHDHEGDGFEVLPLIDERLEVACSRRHPLSHKRKVTLRELAGQSWIVPLRGTYTRHVFDAAFASAGFVPPSAQVECPSFHVSLAVVAQSRLLTIAPRSAVELYARLDNVRRLGLAQPFPTDYAVLVTLKRRDPLPAVESITAALRRLTANAD